MIDYELASQLHRKHKATLTRAKKKGPEYVLEAVDAYFADFRNADLPLTDDWATWEVAGRDARWAIQRTVGQ